VTILVTYQNVQTILVTYLGDIPYNGISINISCHMSWECSSLHFKPGSWGSDSSQFLSTKKAQESCDQRRGDC